VLVRCVRFDNSPINRQFTQFNHSQGTYEINRLYKGHSKNFEIVYSREIRFFHHQWCTYKSHFPLQVLRFSRKKHDPYKSLIIILRAFYADKPVCPLYTDIFQRYWKSPVYPPKQQHDKHGFQVSTHQYWGISHVWHSLSSRKTMKQHIYIWLIK